jgi:cytochrome b subunit of formate dehydrogenase
MKDGSMVDEGEKIRRFSTGRIVEHWVIVAAFGILITTGLSQKFYNLDISQWIIYQLGGIDNVRLIHRYTGIAFAVANFLHVLIAVFGVSFRNWETSMMIKKKDFTDVIYNIQYYIGAKDHPARCDRYDCGIIMIITGFILWFTTDVARLMPGEIIPTAKILHTNQGFLAFLIIAVWHIYNSIFSPEVFPIDTVIFTGKISLARMKKEHPLEYQKLVDEIIEEADYSEYRDYGGVAKDTMNT